VELVKTEIRALTGGSACLVQNVQINDQRWTVFIERISLKMSYSVNGYLYKMGMFFMIVQEDMHICIKMNNILKEYGASNSDWAVFNLYAIGFLIPLSLKLLVCKNKLQKM
jgi:hypothetical protein